MSAKELNIGDYVRTNTGIIEKIEKIYKQNETTETHIQLNKMGTGKSVFILDKGKDLSYSKGEVIKSSPNIIDLLELRDIVELFEEDDVDGELTGFYEVLAYTTDRKEIGVRNKDGEIDFYPSENLRGIITYEQIASIEYKIGE